MNLAVNPGIVAAVVILAVELVIVVVVIGFLLCKGRKDNNQEKVLSDVGESGDYKPKNSESEETVDEDVCVTENEISEEKPEINEEPSESVSEDEKDPKEFESSTSVSSNEKEDEEVKPEMNQAIEQDTILMKDDSIVDDNEKLSRTSSSSSSSSSSYDSSQSSSEEEEKEENELQDPQENNLTNQCVKEEEEERIESSAIEKKEDKANVNCQVIEITTSMPSQLAEPQTEPELSNSTENTEGIMLSLRIEQTASGPVLRVNNDNEKQKRRSVTTETSTESEFDYSTYEYDDKIKVIRRYEMPPDEQILYSGKTQVEDRSRLPSVFSTSEYDINEYSNPEEETVAGIINVTSGEKLTICQAVKNGLIPRKTALLLLEAQAATGSVVNPRNGVKLTVVDAIGIGIVDEEYRQTLIAAEGAFYGYMDPRTGENISLSIAMNRKIFPKNQGIRLLEAQMATGGIIDPWTGLRYSLSDAVTMGLVDRKTANLLKKRVKQTAFLDPTTQSKFGYSDLLSKCTRDLDTGLKFLYIEEKLKGVETRYQPELLTFKTAFRRKVTLQDLIDAGIVENTTLYAFQNGQITKEELRDILHPYLVGENPIAGILNRTTNKVRTICQAVQEGILGRGTAIELLEAQVATGSVIDPFSGKKMSLNKALSVGLVDQRFNSYLKKATQAVYGYTEPGTNRVISIFEAVKKGMVIENHGIRMLEAQIATGGVVDPEGGYRIPIGVALDKGLFDDRMAEILMSTNHDMKGYYDPNTGDNLNYGELMRRCVRSKKKYGSMLLLPVYDKSPLATVSSNKLNSDIKQF